MTPEFKAQWVAALRSGKYQQGHKELRTDETHFCCLGVALDLIDPTKWNINGWGGDDAADPYLWMSDTVPLGKTLNISGDICDQLANMNDGTQLSGIPSVCSFAEIADCIEVIL